MKVNYKCQNNLIYRKVLSSFILTLKISTKITKTVYLISHTHFLNTLINLDTE